MFSLSLGPWAYIIAAAALAAALGGAYVKGRNDGSDIEASRWQAEKIKLQQAELKRQQELADILAERTAQLKKAQQQAAKAVTNVHTEFLPGKTIVKREIVEKPVYRECVVDDSVHNILNAALRGTFATNGAESASAGFMPSRASSASG